MLAGLGAVGWRGARVGQGQARRRRPAPLAACCGLIVWGSGLLAGEYNRTQHTVTTEREIGGRQLLGGQMGSTDRPAACQQALAPHTPLQAAGTAHHASRTGMPGHGAAAVAGQRRGYSDAGGLQAMQSAACKPLARWRAGNGWVGDRLPPVCGSCVPRPSLDCLACGPARSCRAPGQRARLATPDFF
jgi:hypothetical protein